MPYPNWHSARMADPGRFEQGSFRNKTVTDGIELILGRLKGQTAMTVQAYRFAAAKFSVEEARRWLNDRKISPILFEAAAQKTTAFVSVSVRGIQALGGIDILAMVPPDVMAGIKARDPHPFLQAYSICHEGVSTPTVLGDAARPIRWTRAAVQSIKRAVLRGIKFFAGHNADNSTEGREALGEVVWDGQREIDGALHHVVVGHFPDKAKVQAMDVCSQEAEWDFVEQAGSWLATALHRLTGIALSNSKTDRPAFSGARRLAIMQAFDDGAEFDPAADGYIETRRKARMSDIDLSTVPFDALVQEMGRRKTFPSQVFKAEDLKKDAEFGKLFVENERLTKAAADKDGEIKKLTDAKVVSDKTAAAATAKERFGKLINGMKLTPRQKAYVTKSYPEKMDDTSDDALGKFVAQKLEDFKVAAAAFDIKDELPKQAGGDGKQASGSEDMTKAENNPLLAEDLALT